MKKYKLSGRVVRANTERGVGNVRVEAWDSAEVTTDLVAVAVTNQTGDFEISLDQAAVDRHFQGRKPLIALRVFSAGAEEYVTRYTQWKVSPTPATVRIEVDLALTSTKRAPAQSVVRGNVRTEQGAAVANAMVRAYDVKLTSETEIGSSTTDASGHYKISYSSILASGKQRPDLRVIVYNGSNQELGRSALIVRAPSTAVVDLVTSEDQEDRGLSELQQVRSRTAAHTQGVFLGDLQSEQVDFVAQATEVGRARVEALVGAESLWMSVGAAASGDPYYPFVRMGLPTTRRGLLSYPKATLHRVLDEAREAKIVGREVSDDIVDLLTQAAVDLATEAPAGTTCNLGQLLDLDLGGSATRHFIAEYMAFDGTPEAFWAHLALLPEYQGEGSLLIPRLKLLLQLGALTRYHFPLISELWDRWHDSQFDDLKDLAAYSEADWIAILAVQRSGSPINTPDDTPGATLTERRAAYAKVIRRALEVAFPSEAVASAISVIGGSELPTFFNNNPSFKLGKSRAGHYVALNPAAFAGLSNPAAAKLDLKAVERLYKLTPPCAHLLVAAGGDAGRQGQCRRLRLQGGGPDRRGARRSGGEPPPRGPRGRREPLSQARPLWEHRAGRRGEQPVRGRLRLRRARCRGTHARGERPVASPPGPVLGIPRRLRDPHVPALPSRADVSPYVRARGNAVSRAVARPHICGERSPDAARHRDAGGICPRSADPGVQPRGAPVHRADIQRAGDSPRGEVARP